jgi:hypothetical protein
MISGHLQSASSEKVMACGRPNAAESEAEKSWFDIADLDRLETIRLRLKMPLIL